MKTPRSWCRIPAAWAAALAPLAGMLGCEAPPIELPHQPVLRNVKTIAVVPLVDAPGGKAKGSGETVVGAVTEVLYKVPGIRVVERRRLKSIIDEHDLKLSSLTENAAAARLGKLAGADAVLVGEVRQYEAQVDNRSLSIDIVRTSSTKHTHRVGLGVRVVNVTACGEYRPGDVIYADGGQGVSRQGHSPAASAAAEKALKDLVLYFKQRHMESSRE